MKRTDFAKKFISLLLAALVIVQCSPFVLPARAANYTSAEGDGKVALGSTALGYTQVLTDNGDGTFSLALTLEDMSSSKDHNTDSNVSQNGYFTAPADGNYLIELWGGNGANGGDGGTASTGGAGGHVYGIVNLKKGETLFYQLGGNGQQTVSTETGGGVNGDGGNAGDLTTYTIGGGGGYSAIFKFAVGEFESTYLDSDGNLPSDMVISETDRTTKHIMIAAGGGGGGAEPGGFLGYGSDSGQANGGAGGSIGSAAHVLDDGGTVFDGYDGETSGSSTQNVGEHGSYVPGGVSDTVIERLLGILGWDLNMLQSSLANDWYAATNPDAPGGNGGAGNLRGGSGGAGYCGGGGGIQDEIIVANNVGGGGGGSSYLAAEVDYLNVDDSMLHNGAHDSETGGSIHITALAKNDGSTTTLAGLTLTLTPTQYFDLGVSAAEGISVSSEDGVYTVSGITLSEGAQTVTLTFTPKAGFAGGNNVPLLQGNAITCTGTSQVVDSNGATSTTTDTCTIPLKANCSAVNVALNFDVDVINHTTNDPDQNHPVDKLHGDKYAALDLSGWQYDYIQSVSGYTVDTGSDAFTDGEGNLVVSPDETTYYPVSITVVPQSGVAAAVGIPVTTTTFTKHATIVILADGEGDLNGNWIDYHKTLEYDTDTKNYILSLITDISSDYTMHQGSAKEYSAGSGTYTVSANGYYYIQAWGADGGKGLNTSDKTGGIGGFGAYLEGYVYLHAEDKLTITCGSVGTTETGTYNYEHAPGGGGGGYTQVSATISGTTTTLMIAGGGGGGGGARYDWLFSGHHNGLGRGETITKLTGDYQAMLLNGYIMGDTSNAVVVNQNTTLKTDQELAALLENADNFATTFNGGDGAAGGDSSNRIGNNPTAGNAGACYVNTGYIKNAANSSELSADTKTACSERDIDDHRGVIPALNGESVNDANMLSGKVIITPIQLESDTQTEIADYTVSAQLSDYFVLAGTGNDITATGLYETVKDGNGIVTENHEIIIDYTSIDTKGNNLINISNIDPTVTEQESETTVDGVTTTTTTRTAHFEIQIKLKPRAGFLGGNDVPILVATTDTDGITSSMKMSYSQENTEGTLKYLPIGTDPATDYANVEIPEAAIGSIVAAPEENRTIDENKGVTSILLSALYEWQRKPVFPAADSENYWKYAFITLTETVTKKGDTNDLLAADTPQSPQVTTPYTVTVGIAPSKTEKIGAVVIDPVDGITTSKDIEIIVLPRIEYILTNMSTSDPNHAQSGYFTTIESGKDHSATLSANAGYKLPDSIEVKSGETTLTAGNDYTYDASTGKFILFAANAVGTVTVSATAAANTYTVTYYYPNKLSAVTPTKVVGDTYTVGQPLAETPPTDMATETGYTFQWDWGNGATTPPATMPEKNLIVIGSYVANKYPLTIYYVDTNNTTIADPTTVADIPYGSTYTVTAPDISGYAPVLSTVDVPMDTTEGKTITLEYIPTASQLVVKYLHAYTNEELFAQKTLPIATGGTLILPEVPGKTGYTASAHLYSDGTEFVNSGTVSAEQATNGIYLMVYYTPNTYTVILDLNGGSAAVTERTVEYDNIYNYDPTTQKYPGLPTPGRVGYEFDGWYLGETKVEGTTTVTTAADHTLVAKWKAGTGTVTIVFVDENGNSLSFKDDKGNDYTYKTLEGTIGESFSYTPPAKAEYEFTPPTVTGTFTAVPQRITVTYSVINKTYTLTIEYLYGDSGTQAAEPYTKEFTTVGMNNGDNTYLVDSPVISGYTASQTTVSGTMTTANKTITVYYYLSEQEDVIYVTVNWGDLNFTYTQTNWDPQTHTYGSEITPITPNTNTVEVISGSETNIMLNVSLSYEAVNDYNTLSGYFTKTENDYGTKVTNYTLSPNSAQKSYFWLNGTLTPDQVTAIQDGGGTATSGNCIVTITEG